MKRSPINRQSTKKAADRAQRRELVEALQRAGLWECQIGPVLRRAEWELGGIAFGLGADGCTWEPSGIHERMKRSSGGSLTMLSNLLPACSPCNYWVETFPEDAHRIGLVVRPGDPDWFLCERSRRGT